MSCQVLSPGGANSNCKAILDEAIGAIVTDPSFNWATAGDLDNIENLRVLLQETRKGFVVEFNGSTPTDSELQTETTGFGDTIVTAENAPTLLGFVETNACDFAEVLSVYKGGTYNVAYILGDGTIMLTDKITKLQGFQTQVWAQAVSVPGRENKTQQFKIMFNHLKVREFNAYKVVPVNYTIDEVLELLPLGLTATVKTPYVPASGIIVLNVTTRCVPDDPKTGVMTGEVVKATPGLTITITPTDNGGGEYSVLIQKSGPANLAAGEYCEFRLVTKSGAIYDDISNVIKVVGA